MEKQACRQRGRWLWCCWVMGWAESVYQAAVRLSQRVWLGSGRYPSTVRPWYTSWYRILLNDIISYLMTNVSCSIIWIEIWIESYCEVMIYLTIMIYAVKIIFDIIFIWYHDWCHHMISWLMSFAGATEIIIFHDIHKSISLKKWLFRSTKNSRDTDILA